jgi:hypothetical protein
MAKIQINRDAGYADASRKYKIELDGDIAGEIRASESVTLNVTPGNHKIRLRIDWCSSNYLDFQVAPEETVVFDCGNNSPLGLVILYITIFRNKYLWIQKRESQEA